MLRGSWRARSELGTLLPFGKALYREQAVAVFRLLASLAFVLEFPLIGARAAGHESLVRYILFGYAAFSLVVAVRVFIVRPLSSVFLVFVHSSDVFWPALICLFTGCSRSPFILLFTFAVLVAPYRRKSIETLIVAIVSIFVVVSESTLAALPAMARFHLGTHPLELAPFAIRAAIVLVLGGFLAYTAHWSEREQQAYAVRSILSHLRADVGIQGNLREILPAIVEIFEASRVVLVVQSASTWRVFEWGSASNDPDSPLIRDVPTSEEDTYFWPMPEETTAIAWSRSGRRRDLVGLDREGGRIHVEPRSAENILCGSHPFTTLLTCAMRFGNEWTGRIFLIDPPCAAGRETCLRLLQQLANEVGPAVYDFYLWQHTSVRVRAVERKRLARDLHDGVVQSLIATELRVDALRRKSEQRKVSPETVETLESAQGILRAEVLRLRSQIDQLRSSMPRPVHPSLAEILSNFRHDTGIETRFACEVQEDAIPPGISGELVRIVEEALSNVRRHSGARTVDVRLARRGNAWEVVIQDDGCGFDFTGRLSLAQLDAAGKGPRVIRERVHLANGDLVLESWPDRGARLKIRLAATS